MANQEHLDILKQGVFEWNKWRGENSDPDLSGADLYGADLSGANLHGADLSAAHLNRANLSGAHLNEANLRDAKVSDEEIADCNILYGATMPDGNRYDGRFSLEGDIAFAREEGIKTDDSSAMTRWYAGDD